MADTSLDDLARRWTELHAPATGDLRGELAAEAAEYFQLTLGEVERRMAVGSSAFAAEWAETNVNTKDAAAVTRFYDTSATEVFDLLEWHATDPIHCRTLVCVDVARNLGGTRYLDFGAGIGTDAIAFGKAGFEVTLADIAAPLLTFAEWRCRRRGIPVRVVDLKKELLPRGAFDVVTCFDVLEHIRNPVPTVRSIRDSLAFHGLLFLHAPYGEDTVRPMHLAHKDVVTPRLRSMGFHNRPDCEAQFPRTVWAPRVYERLAPNVIDRAGYYMQDVLLPGSAGKRLAQAYRRFKPRRV